MVPTLIAYGAKMPSKKHKPISPVHSLLVTGGMRQLQMDHSFKPWKRQISRHFSSTVYLPSTAQLSRLATRVQPITETGDFAVPTSMQAVFCVTISARARRVR
jgi:hypothetical protein